MGVLKCSSKLKSRGLERYEEGREPALETKIVDIIK